MPPKPTPTVLLNRRGSWRANTRANEATPEPVSDAEPPKGMSRKAKAMWRELAPHLMQCGLLKTADRDTFARYCETYQMWKAAVKEMQSKPLDRSNVLLLAKLDTMLHKLEAGFGLTPADRAGISVEPPSDSGKARFFDGTETRKVG